MAGRPRGRNSRNHYVHPRTEHDDRVSRPSTSRGGSGYSDRHNFNKRVTFKANQRGGNNFRKSWDSKTNLVREQLDGEFSSRNGQSRNNSSRRSFPDRNYNRGGGYGNFRNPSWTLKESITGWFCVLVPNVEDGNEVMKIIQTYITPIVFHPYNKQYFENALRFLVDDFKVARTLHNTSYKITLRDDRKLIIRVNPYLPPRGPISFTPVLSDVREKMIEAMATRYNPSTKSLDLSRFYGCSLFTENQLFVSLNRPAVLLAALNMVAQHTKNDLYGLSLENNHIYLSEGLVWIRRLFPELKVLDLAGNKFSDLKELKCLSGFTIEVLNLSRNPVCDTEDKERYKRDVQQLFPILQKLDNSELPSRYSAIAGNKLKIPINQGNSYPIPEGVNPDQPNPVKTLVESFLSEFYERYDNKVSRQLVADAYHESATFSISSCFLCNLSRGTLAQYSPLSRNTLKYNKNNKSDKSRYIYSGRENIINILEKLPKTKHDLVSFQVDVPSVNSAIVQIVVNGVFAEEFRETSIRNVFRSFSRTFCIVPVGNGWSIMNDALFVTVVSDEILLESAKRFHVYRPKQVSTKKNNLNDNNNVTMFMEDSEEMSGMELSTYQQPDTPNYPPPPYQEQPSFSSYHVSGPINPQQTSLYHGSSQTPIMQNQQIIFQQQNHSAVTSVSLEAPPPPYQLVVQQSNTSFLTPAQVPVNQPPTENCLNSIGDSNSNTNLAMIKSFSNESGMNYKWAEKCLQDNNWDYAKAALCFAKLKPSIPPDAFTNTN